MNINLIKLIILQNFNAKAIQHLTNSIETKDFFIDQERTALISKIYDAAIMKKKIYRIYGFIC